jgi:hypothetical protein
MERKAAPSDRTVSNDPASVVSAPTAGTEPIAPAAAPPPGHGHGHHPHIEFKFFEQLKQRNVVRVALLYLVACWLILDPLHVAFHMLEVPAWANRLVVILMAIGFPAVLLFAWAASGRSESQAEAHFAVIVKTPRVRATPTRSVF